MGSLIITRRFDKIMTLLIEDNRLLLASADEPDAINVGDIYIGKVMNVLKNIDGAFLDIEKGITCFLPLDKSNHVTLLNREFDGRIIAGDELLVQVEKDAIKTKNAQVTTNLSFTGKYCVITTGKKSLGFSTKLSKECKQSLKDYINQYFSDYPFDLVTMTNRGTISDMEYGIVVRTNAGKLFDYQLLCEEIVMLMTRCLELIDKAKYRTVYSKMKETPDHYITSIRDTYSNLYDKIVTDDPVIHEKLKEYLRVNQPEDLKKLHLYNDPSLSINALYGLEAKLETATNKTVWLKSGGYLVIEPTEALTVIDVNTGKNISKRSKEDNFYAINKEAAAEIAIQLRLRNLSGMILVDFINMESKEQESALLLLLTDMVHKDPVKTKVVDMTPLGLVEITRKKVHKTLLEQLK